MRQKRKRNSRSVQVHDSHQSTPPTSSTSQPVSAGEGNEMPERKRMRKETFEKLPSPHFFVRRGSSSQGQQVEDQAAFSGHEVLPPANQQVKTPPAQVQSSASSDENSKVDLTVEGELTSITSDITHVQILLIFDCCQCYLSFNRQHFEPVWYR